MVATYDTFMKLLEKGELGKKRVELIASAYGRVLEIGAGTGANVHYYIDDKVEEIIFSDKEISPFLEKKLKDVRYKYDIQMMNVESIPYEAESFDTIVVTLVFCSTKDVQIGLNELRRVLKENGQLIFIEHVLPEQDLLKNIFNIATPVWKHIASGCHLNRNFLAALEQASFRCDQVSRFNKTAFLSGKAYKKAKS